MKQSYRVAIVGCGVVGSATATHILQQNQLIAERNGINLEIVAIADRDFRRAREAGLPENLLVTDVAAVLSRDDVDLVVETVGGVDFAFDVIRDALVGGKHVVTANKALLAHRGTELFRTAHEHGRQLAFEASCGGGIPVVRALTEGLAGNRIDALYGIVNGTCNYILSQMIAQSISYDEALAAAQRLGLAEADPSLDVGGQDSAHKIAIMAALAFGVSVDYDGIPVVGIDSLDLLDMSWASRLGYVPKLLAIAERTESGVSLRVRPSFVPASHPLAWVSGPFNAVSVYSYPTGHTLYYGRGAGGSATSGAIVSDILGIATGAYGRVFETANFWPDRSSPIHQNTDDEIFGRYYVRSMVEDRPGMLGEIAMVYGNHGISLASVHQDELSGTDRTGAVVPVVVVTHKTNERELLKAVSSINGMSRIHGECSVVSIIDEPDEKLLVH